MQPILDCNHVHYSYHTLQGETPALCDIQFHVDEGEFVSIVGPSGCGKSTLLSLLCGLIVPESGAIYFKGAPVTAAILDIRSSTITCLNGEAYEKTSCSALKSRKRFPNKRSLKPITC